MNWDELVIHLMLSTGMTVDQVREQFDLPRLAAYNAYTERYPPQHMLIAAYFGYGKEKEVQPLDGAELAELMSAFPQVQR